MTTVLIILTITIVLFIWGKWPPDIVALLSMIALYLSGILTTQETLSGFSNTTVIMIGALFIIGEGLSRTGWTALAGRYFVTWARKSVPKLLVIVTLGAGMLSGFVSNTGTVATLLPVTISAAWSAGTLPSKLLMPIAFGSNTGGLLTLTGTPPNIIVSNTLVENNLDGFSFFEFALIGLPLLIIAILYFRFIGFRLLPSHKTSNKPVDVNAELSKWISNYSIGDNLYRLRIRSMSPMINTRIKEWHLDKDYSVSIVRLKRRHPNPNPVQHIPKFVELPDPETEMRYHDIITVKGNPEAIDRLVTDLSLGIIPIKPEKEMLKNELLNQEVGMAEMLVTPKSILVGRTLQLGQYFKEVGLQVIGASRGNKPLKAEEVKVQAGDAFVIRGQWQAIEALQKRYENVVITGSPEALLKNMDMLSPKSYIALGVLILMVILLVLNIFSGAITVLICAGIMLLTGCVPIPEAYNSVSWTSVIMIGAMIPMGLALQKTGVAKLAAESLVSSLGAIHPIVLLIGLFLLTTAFSQTINNSATAVLMAPIALMAATSLGVSPKPLMITVAISASTAFLTPVGTTTNAMVMTSGNYSFLDYVKVGGPLLLLFLITTIILVPLIWNF